MLVYGVRVAIFTLLPLLAAAVVAALDKGCVSRERRLELYLMYLFGLGVAGSGIGGFVGHVFLSDTVARSVGWQTGSPFQLEMGFANLALGALGLVAAARRDGFREATVIAVTVIGVGASITHLIDMLQTGNLAPGNTVQNIANLARPLLLISFLRMARVAQARPSAPADTSGLSDWLRPHGQAVGWLTAMVSTGFGLGYALDRPAIGAAVGVGVGAVCVWALLTRR